MTTTEIENLTGASTTEIRNAIWTLKDLRSVHKGIDETIETLRSILNARYQEAEELFDRIVQAELDQTASEEQQYNRISHYAKLIGEGQLDASVAVREAVQERWNNR